MGPEFEQIWPEKLLKSPCESIVVNSKVFVKNVYNKTSLDIAAYST